MTVEEFKSLRVGDLFYCSTRGNRELLQLIVTKIDEHRVCSRDCDTGREYLNRDLNSEPIGRMSLYAPTTQLSYDGYEFVPFTKDELGSIDYDKEYTIWWGHNIRPHTVLVNKSSEGCVNLEGVRDKVELHAVKLDSLVGKLGYMKKLKFVPFTPEQIAKMNVGDNAIFQNPYGDRENVRLIDKFDSGYVRFTSANFELRDWTFNPRTSETIKYFGVAVKETETSKAEVKVAIAEAAKKKFVVLTPELASKMKAGDEAVSEYGEFTETVKLVSKFGIYYKFERPNGLFWVVDADGLRFFSVAEESMCTDKFLAVVEAESECQITVGNVKVKVPDLGSAKYPAKSDLTFDDLKKMKVGDLLLIDGYVYEFSKVTADGKVEIIRDGVVAARLNSEFDTTVVKKATTKKTPVTFKELKERLDEEGLRYLNVANDGRAYVLHIHENNKTYVRLKYRQVGTCNSPGVWDIYANDNCNRYYEIVAEDDKVVVENTTSKVDEVLCPPPTKVRATPETATSSVTPKFIPFTSEQMRKLKVGDKCRYKFYDDEIEMAVLDTIGTKGQYVFTVEGRRRKSSLRAEPDTGYWVEHFGVVEEGSAVTTKVKPIDIVSLPPTSSVDVVVKEKSRPISISELVNIPDELFDILNSDIRNGWKGYVEVHMEDVVTKLAKALNVSEDEIFIRSYLGNIETAYRNSGFKVTFHGGLNGTVSLMFHPRTE